MNLYQISEQYISLINNLCDAETGEVNENAMINLTQIGDSLNEQIINVIKAIKNIEGDVIAINAEKERMASREKDLKHKCQRLRRYAIEAMKKCDIERVKSPEFEINLRLCPPSVKIDDEQLIPSIYFRTKTEEKVDLIGIKKAILAGEKVPGAVLTNEHSIQIK